MMLTFVVAVLDWNSADLSRFIIGLPLFVAGFGITVFSYFNLGLGNTYCGADGLVSRGLYRFSRNPKYASSILGLVGLVICANSWLTVPLAILMSGAYVLMAPDSALLRRSRVSARLDRQERALPPSELSQLSRTAKLSVAPALRSQSLSEIPLSLDKTYRKPPFIR
jgi:protein-S-isoprenylcysteine O-methyltransferase Ste14